MSTVGQLRKAVWRLQKGHKREGILFYNKYRFKNFISERGVKTPVTYEFFRRRAQVRDYDFTTLPQAFVIKPNKASRGAEVYNFRRLPDGRFKEIDGRIHPPDFVAGKIGFILLNRGAGGALVEEAITNPPPFEQFLKGQQGIVDVRFYMLYDEPLFAKARIPTKQSEGYSNTGRKAAALFVNSDGFIVPDDIFKNTGTRHPDFPIDYKGTPLPKWKEFIRVAVKVAQMFDLPFHSVDMTIAANGEGCVIESEMIPLLSHFTSKGCDVVLEKIKNARVSPGV